MTGEDKESLKKRLEIDRRFESTKASTFCWECFVLRSAKIVVRLCNCVSEDIKLSRAYLKASSTTERVFGIDERAF